MITKEFILLIDHLAVMFVIEDLQQVQIETVICVPINNRTDLVLVNDDVKKL